MRLASCPDKLSITDLGIAIAPARRGCRKDGISGMRRRDRPPLPATHRGSRV